MLGIILYLLLETQRLLCSYIIIVDKAPLFISPTVIIWLDNLITGD